MSVGRKNATPPCGHVFKRTSTIFDLSTDIISTNILTKFHRHWTTNVTSIVITRKTGPPPGSNVFQQTRTIFKLIRDMFHEDWTINVTSRVLKRFYYTLKLYKVTATTTCGHLFHSTGTIFELALLHVFQPTGTIFELVQDIIRTNVLTKFHEDWTLNLTYTVKTAPPPGGHVFLPTGTIFELVKDFIGTHVPTKFHDDWTKNVTSRVLTRKTATPPGIQFHEDWTINVTSKCRTDGQLDGRTTPKQYPFASGGFFEELRQTLGIGDPGLTVKVFHYKNVLETIAFKDHFKMHKLISNNGYEYYGLGASPQAKNVSAGDQVI
ncbi:hypothetical protein DPMN_163223 [Dreissena polymorpha]|uniref:Uncharacterized protein n=1 Tax=Dreissena polymorpha TaxID=45954 RepID=A0A9D4ET24_DREPO|nr:hypothetical protein DPMN_163223 [Dreissena polymorpha]